MKDNLEFGIIWSNFGNHCRNSEQHWYGYKEQLMQFLKQNKPIYRTLKVKVTVKVTKPSISKFEKRWFWHILKPDFTLSVEDINEIIGIAMQIIIASI